MLENYDFSLLCRKRRECRSGAGFEANKNQCDTPGFPLQENPTIELHRKAKKLYLPRNHKRINQTSIDMLRSWRGNCDIQFLVYDSDPENVNVKEISRVTDYIIGYIGKGNSTYMQEIETNKHIAMKAEETTGDDQDLKVVVKKILNKSASRRIISKQEACVLLVELKLTSCSEMIDTISINNNKRITLKTNNTDNSYMARYAKRTSHHHCTMYEYHKHDRLMRKLPFAIPHFTGFSSTPTFPITERFAKHMLIVHKPWTLQCPCPTSWKPEFDRYINSPGRSKVARMIYDRIVQRHYSGGDFVEPVSSEPSHNEDFDDAEAENAFILAGLNGDKDKATGHCHFEGICRGETHKWDKEPKVSGNRNFRPTRNIRLTKT